LHLEHNYREYAALRLNELSPTCEEYAKLTKRMNAMTEQLLPFTEHFVDDGA
jgi:hypothetical protein